MKKSDNITVKEQDFTSALRSRGYEFRPTTDQWYPNFPKNLVAVSPVLKLTDGKFRVCVWGADDFGMEIDVATKREAKQIRDSLPGVITIDDLETRGFVRA